MIMQSHMKHQTIICDLRNVIFDTFSHLYMYILKYDAHLPFGRRVFYIAHTTKFAD